MTKTELRKIYLGRRKELSEFERKRKSRQIAERFFARFDLNRINFLHGFLPIERLNEIDTKLIFSKVWRDFPHLETIVPRVNWQTNEIENLIFRPETKLIRNFWRIDEPEGADLVATEKIDLVLVPLLCFDARGYRVGYGKGFYDRFLESCRPNCLKIGLSFFPPVAEISDPEAHDVKLDYGVTPEEIFTPHES